MILIVWVLLGKCTPNGTGTTIYVDISEESAIDEIVHILSEFGEVSVDDNTARNTEVQRNIAFRANKEKQKDSLPTSLSVFGILERASKLYAEGSSTANQKQKRKFSAKLMTLGKRSFDLSADGLRVQKQETGSDEEWVIVDNYVNER